MLSFMNFTNETKRYVNMAWSNLTFASTSRLHLLLPLFLLVTQAIHPLFASWNGHWINLNITLALDSPGIVYTALTVSKQLPKNNTPCIDTIKSFAELQCWCGLQIQFIRIDLKTLEE